VQKGVGYELPEIGADRCEHELFGPDSQGDDSLSGLRVDSGPDTENEDYNIEQYNDVICVWCFSWAYTCANRYHIYSGTLFLGLFKRRGVILTARCG